MRKQRQAFTLMEIMIVVIIVGILATIALPAYHMTVEKSHAAEGVQMLGSLYSAAKIYKFEKGNFPTLMGSIDLTFSDIEYFSAPVLKGTNASVAEVSRVGGAVAYDLGVDSNGDIFCVSATANYCSRLGF